MKKMSWIVPASDFSRNTFNPIRNAVEIMKLLTPHPEKPMISLSIGDPTVFGNLAAPDEAIEAVVSSVRSMKFNGYAPSTGYEDARRSVANYVSAQEATVEAQDVVLCSGCSCALDMCISVLANPGQNILLPRPGFPLYRTLAEGLGIQTKFYNLKPECGWEIDLEQLESLIDKNTAAIVINNPSNPCGSCYSRSHLEKILQVAARNSVPIIADEIYDYFVFPGHKFYPMATLTEEVPILKCGGLTKRFLVPGWRMGWIVIHDRNNAFSLEIRKGLQRLTHRIIGSSTILQGALNEILTQTPPEFFEATIAQVHNNAQIAHGLLSELPGLRPIMPAGAMYMMVGVDMNYFPEFDNDLQFVRSLLTEESVSCLPGECFNYHNYFRIVLTVPVEKLREACARIGQFCANHYSQQRMESPFDNLATL